jgi:integrase
VVKWSVALQAAFERANRNGGKKCVRGVVPSERLLHENPWKNFTWIEGRKKVIRQFSGSEIISLLDHLESTWADIPVGSLLAKVFLWSAARKSEVTSLQWGQLRQFGEEYHFQIVGKWAVERWFRIPANLIQELSTHKTASPYVFSAYNDQLRKLHERGPNPRLALQVSGHFSPSNLADWFYERLRKWATAASVPPVNIHVFRKTSLQYARTGEDVNRQVAHDASVGERVMMGSYVNESDLEMRQRSNRTFSRIANGFGHDLATRLGWKESSVAPAQAIKVAIEANDWDAVLKLAAQMAAQKNSASADGQSL